MAQQPQQQEGKPRFDLQCRYQRISIIACVGFFILIVVFGLRLGLLYESSGRMPLPYPLSHDFWETVSFWGSVICLLFWQTYLRLWGMTEMEEVTWKNGKALLLEVCTFLAGMSFFLLLVQKPLPLPAPNILNLVLFCMWALPMLLWVLLQVGVFGSFVGEEQEEDQGGITEAEFNKREWFWLRLAGNSIWALCIVAGMIVLLLWTTFFTFIGHATALAVLGNNPFEYLLYLIGSILFCYELRILWVYCEFRAKWYRKGHVDPSEEDKALWVPLRAMLCSALLNYLLLYFAFRVLQGDDQFLEILLGFMIIPSTVCNLVAVFKCLDVSKLEDLF